MYDGNSIFENNFEILRENLIDGTHQDVQREECFTKNDEVRAIEEIPHPYQEIFAGYPCFNRIQSKVLDDVLYSDNSLVISAPTGSGKTVVFELAIVRLLLSLEHTQFSQPFKIIYIAPVKALCEERLVDWHKKFAKFGINCISVTGDSQNFEFQQLLNHNLIITTPEKWDCLTRKWRENLNLVQVIKLFIIDEVHLLSEETRGSSLETIVCRMKTIQQSVNSSIDNDLRHKIRFVAVSAAVPNIEDLAEWIDPSPDVKYYKFGNEYRPVKLTKIVLGYPHSAKMSPFKFDISLNYKLQSLIMQYSHGKPTLIFCGTRKIVEMTAKHLLQHLTINLKPEQKDRLREVAEGISDSKVKETLIYGVGYHHAGMLPPTRRAIENCFRNSELPILVTTSTLAMGVNLPAHLVIVKSTKCYANGGFKDYTETALLQMIGRAGRPQFDTEATAVILTSSQDKEKFEKMIGGVEPIESNLHRHLIEHLNAEVVLQTITDLEVAMRWLSSTFLYIRARKNPRFYGLTSSDPTLINRRLQDMCQIELNKLIKGGMLTIDQDVMLKATSVGTAMAKYYLAFETMKLFTQITGSEILQQVLSLISKCYEFSEMYLRVNDKKCLNLLNKCRSRETIRFPLNGKIKTLDMKINCIIQAVLGCLDICDHSILTEASKIMRNGQRIVNCLIEYLESKDKCFQALLNTIILAKCFLVQLWENSPYVSKQLRGIGTVMSSQLVKAGKTSFQLLSECDPREIEMILGKRPPTGSKLLEYINHLPKYQLTLESVGKKKIKLTVSLTNVLDLETECTVNKNSLMFLLVGDDCNNILLYEKYSHSFFIENPDLVKFIDFQDNNINHIEAYLISEDWVGIDSTAKYELVPKVKIDEVKAKTLKPTKKPLNDSAYMQTFMEMYMKSKKNKNESIESERSDTKKKELVGADNVKSSVYHESNNSKIIVHGNITIVDKFDKTSQDIEEVESEDMKCIDYSDKKHLKQDTLISFARGNAQGSSTSKELSQKEIVRKFEFTPKKVIHKRQLSLENSFNSASPIKKPNLETKPKSQTKITWRSPLTYSPPVKFSPKINFTTCPNLSTTSSSPSVNESQTTSRFFEKVHGKLDTSQSKVVFFLSDKDVADSSMEESVDKRDEVLQEVGDFVSTQFLETCGLIQRKQDTLKSQQNIKPNEYYHQLLSQPTKTKSEVKQEQNSVSKSDLKFENTYEYTTAEYTKRPPIKQHEVKTEIRYGIDSTPKSREFHIPEDYEKTAPKRTVKDPESLMTYGNGRGSAADTFYTVGENTNVIPQDNINYNIFQRTNYYPSLNQTSTNNNTESPYFSVTNKRQINDSFARKVQDLSTNNSTESAYLSAINSRQSNDSFARKVQDLSTNNNTESAYFSAINSRQSNDSFASKVQDLSTNNSTESAYFSATNSRQSNDSVARKVQLLNNRAESACFSVTNSRQSNDSVARKVQNLSTFKQRSLNPYETNLTEPGTFLPTQPKIDNRFDNRLPECSYHPNYNHSTLLRRRSSSENSKQLRRGKVVAEYQQNNLFDDSWDDKIKDLPSQTSMRRVFSGNSNETEDNLMVDDYDDFVGEAEEELERYYEAQEQNRRLGSHQNQSFDLRSQLFDMRRSQVVEPERSQSQFEITPRKNASYFQEPQRLERPFSYPKQQSEIRSHDFVPSRVSRTQSILNRSNSGNEGQNYPVERVPKREPLHSMDYSFRDRLERSYLQPQPVKRPSYFGFYNRTLPEETNDVSSLGYSYIRSMMEKENASQCYAPSTTARPLSQRENVPNPNIFPSDVNLPRYNFQPPQSRSFFRSPFTAPVESYPYHDELGSSQVIGSGADIYRPACSNERNYVMQRYFTDIDKTEEHRPNYYR